MRANRGKGWEARLVTQHALYRAEGRAVIFKAEPGIKGGHYQKAPPDFFGCAGGVPILFDAKECAGPRWGFSQLKEHQAKALTAWQRAGGEAGIALRIGEVAWWVPWTALAPPWWDWKEKGWKPASANVKWLSQNARRMDGADWLAVAL